MCLATLRIAYALKKRSCIPYTSLHVPCHSQYCMCSKKATHSIAFALKKQVLSSKQLMPAYGFTADCEAVVKNCLLLLCMQYLHTSLPAAGLRKQVNAIPVNLYIRLDTRQLSPRPYHQALLQSGCWQQSLVSRVEVMSGQRQMASCGGLLAPWAALGGYGSDY